MVSFVLPLFHPLHQPADGRLAATAEKPAGFTFHKAAKSVFPVAQLVLGDHIAAVLVAENVEILVVLPQPADFGIGERVQLFTAGQTDYPDGLLAEKVAGVGKGQAGLPELPGDLMRSVIRGGIGTGGQITAVGNGQNAPPVRKMFEEI